MIINAKLIQSFNPCKERFDNYLTFYSDFEGSFDAFLDLSEITYADKIWIAKRILNKNQLVHWAILCAESVLPIFEKKYPNETSVRDLLNLLKSIPDYSNLTSEQRTQILEQRSKARAAAYAAADYAADDAAYAAYAAYAAAAAYAAYAAAYAAYARENQRDLNLQFLKMAASL